MRLRIEIADAKTNKLLEEIIVNVPCECEKTPKMITRDKLLELMKSKLACEEIFFNAPEEMKKAYEMLYGIDVS